MKVRVGDIVELKYPKLRYKVLGIHRIPDAAMT